MLKSLGQWTDPSIRSRKVIPAGLTIATIRQPDSENHDRVEDDDHTNEIVTPKGRVLNLRLGGDRINGDNERLVVIEARERDVVQEDIHKAIKLTFVYILYSSIYIFR